MNSVGIVGVGFVGNALNHSLKTLGMKTFAYDKYRKDNVELSSLKSVVENCDIIFLCLPTPMDSNDGSCDLSYIRNAVTHISYLMAENTPKKELVLKSTVPPGTTDVLAKEFPKFDWIFNPEFLTERTAIVDFLGQSSVILGGPTAEYSRAKVLYRQFEEQRSKISNKSLEIVCCSATEAEMVKYTTNAFFSTKITFFNVVKEMCDNLDISYENFSKILNYDGRIHPMHQQVPGPDGKRGFSGKCFPKDFNGFISKAEGLGIDVSFLREIWNRNLKVRTEREWENIPGATDIKGFE